MNEKYQVDPLTGMPVVNNQQAITKQPQEQEMTITPPAASSLVSPFSPKAIEVGNSVMGTIEQRQQSLGNSTPLFKKSCGSYKK
jgi:hypothetical protein